MFYYFGRKKALAGRYPSPILDTIVEPFAGSGAYSLHANHWERQVVLIELDKRIAALWWYLQSATRADIAALPDLEPGDRLSAHEQLCDEERLLISLHIGPGKNRTNDVVSKFSRWPAGRRAIMRDLHKVRHWRIEHADSLSIDLGIEQATWFVDPPYQRSGRLYRHHDCDYDQLATWVHQLRGQVIVCEQAGATWLPFEPLADLKVAGHHVSKEMVLTWQA